MPRLRIAAALLGLTTTALAQPAPDGVPAPSCVDQVKNGDETDVDCGGACAPCGERKACLRGVDCASGVCTNNACVAASSCANGVRDGLESDVDCGGPSCGKCPDGRLCSGGGDCQSGFCGNNACQAARTSDTVDTRLNLTLTNENLLVKPGETNPSVPGIRFDRPSVLGIMFFDNYDTRFSGYENLTHMIMYKKVTGARFEGEGSLVFRFLEFSDVSLQSIDDGSYIKITYFLDPARKKKSNFSLVAFPLSADRMRLGYSYRLSWGGSPIFFKYNPDLPTTSQTPVNQAPAPGARLQWADERFALWVGFKTTILLNRNPEINEQQAIVAVLGGGSVDIVKEHFRLDFNGGFFQRGTNQNLYSTQVIPPGGHYRDYEVDTGGGSVQLSLFSGIAPSTSIDFMLYRNDPTSVQRFFTRPNYRPGFNWLIQSEFTLTATTLQDAEKVDTTVRQFAYAGDVNMRAQFGKMRLKADAALRSLEFILLNQPSLVPYVAFPKDAKVTPDLFFSAGGDYFFERIGLTAGLTVGVDLPATFSPPPGFIIPMQICGNVESSLCTTSTLVVRGEGDYSILPLAKSGGSEKAVPVFAAKLQLREDFLEYFAMILDVYYTIDQNQTRLGKAFDGSQTRVFNSQPNQLGFNLSLQARF